MRKLDRLLLGNIENKAEFIMQAGKFLKRLSISLNEICKARESKIIFDFDGNCRAILITNLGSQCIVSIRLSIEKGFKGLVFNVIESYGVKRRGEIYEIKLYDMVAMSYYQIADMIVKNTIYKEVVKNKLLI